MTYSLAHVVVRNFRSCEYVEMPLASFTPFVGYNNAGKSNLLMAIRWLVAPYPLVASDFHDLGESVVIEGSIEGITSEILDRLVPRHRSRIEPLLHGSGILKIRREMAVPGNAKSSALFVWDTASGETGDWILPPTGIPESLKVLLPEPVVIGAMEDAAEDASRVKSSNTIGKLLAEFAGALETAHADQLATVLSELRGCFDADGESRSEALRQFDAESTAVLGDYFPGVSLHLEIPVPEMGALLKGATLKVSESSGAVRDFTSLGHGAQRSIQMAMIQYLATVRDRVDGTGVESGQRLLIIDEPELFLHPQAIEQVRGALKKLARTGYQVLFTTHSPLMIDRQAVPATRLVRKAMSTTVASTLADVLERYVADAGSRLQTLLDLKNAKGWLFADRVLLVEGITETRVLPDLIEAVTGKSLAARSIALVQVDGGSALPDCMKVLDALGMSCMAVADLDFVVDKAQSAGLIAKHDPLVGRMLEEFTEVASEEPRVSLGGNGRPCRDKQKKDCMEPADVVTLWATTAGAATASALRDALLDHKIWLWPAGDIEHHLGIPDKKGPTHAKFVHDLELSGWRAAVDDCAAVEELASWLDGVAG